MTQENKSLLLKELSARLPYGLIVELDEKFRFNKGTHTLVKELLDSYCVEGIKPYLRPMSSMTEEERKHWRDISLSCPDWDFTARCLDWLNSRHFDYRGLIEKGLALEATEDMYNSN